MSKLLVFSLLFIMFCTSHCQDYTKTDYCKLATNIGCVKDADPYEGGHEACNCTPVPPRIEVQGNDSAKISAFRRKILEVHNQYRNWVASGRRTPLPEAANMMVLNYDMELEHIARCYGLNSFRSPLRNKTCWYDSKNESYIQSLHGSSKYQQGTGPVLGYIKDWYEEVEQFHESLISEYDGRYPNRHFTQMVWAETTHIGCVRVWNEELPDTAYRLALICNYKRAGNVLRKPVYRKGKSCSACPGGTRCETEKYPALCGKLLGKADRITQNWVLVIITSSVFMVLIF